MEQAHRVRATADAGVQAVGQPAFGGHHLFARLAPDHRLEIAHELGIGMRAGDGTDDVEGILNVGHPIAQGLVHGIFQRA